MPERSPLRSQPRWLVALTLSLLAAVLTLAVGLALLRAAGVDVRRGLWLVRNRLLGPEPVGIWQADERLGWRHVPGSSGRQREVPDYDVTYHIDSEGFRVTPGSVPGRGPLVLFLGGSFTFGHGVEDPAPYPALLQQAWPDRRVVNAAVNAWGSVQALLVLRDVLAREKDVALVVYGFISHHLMRNDRSGAWLRQLDTTRGRRNPFFEVVDDQLVFRGLADPERDAAPDDRAQRAREARMTVRLLAEMARECALREIPFVVVQLPDGGRGMARGVLERAVGAANVIDLESRLDYETLHYRHDIHLTEHGHREVADALLPELDRRMRKRP